MKCVICRGDNIVLKEVLEHIEEGHNVIEFPVNLNLLDRYFILNHNLVRELPRCPWAILEAAYEVWSGNN